MIYYPSIYLHFSLLAPKYLFPERIYCSGSLFAPSATRFWPKKYERFFPICAPRVAIELQKSYYLTITQSPKKWLQIKWKSPMKKRFKSHWISVFGYNLTFCGSLLKEERFLAISERRKIQIWPKYYTIVPVKTATSDWIAYQITWFWKWLEINKKKIILLMIWNIQKITSYDVIWDFQSFPLKYFDVCVLY